MTNVTADIIAKLNENQRTILRGVVKFNETYRLNFSSYSPDWDVFERLGLIGHLGRLTELGEQVYIALLSQPSLDDMVTVARDQYRLAHGALIDAFMIKHGHHAPAEWLFTGQTRFDWPVWLRGHPFTVEHMPHGGAPTVMTWSNRVGSFVALPGQLIKFNADGNIYANWAHLI